MDLSIVVRNAAKRNDTHDLRSLLDFNDHPVEREWGKRPQMRSNGNCRGISYRGYAHTGNTATAVPVTVLNQLDVGEAPPHPSVHHPFVSVRRFETFEPRISRYFQSQIFSFSRRFVRRAKSFERGVRIWSKKTSAGEGRKKEREGEEEEVAREGQEGGGGEERKKKKRKKQRKERGGGARRRRRKGLELRLRWKRDSRWSWDRSIRSSRPTAGVAAAGALRYIEAASLDGEERHRSVADRSDALTARTTLFPERSAIIFSRARSMRARSTVLLYRRER